MPDYIWDSPWVLQQSSEKQLPRWNVWVRTAVGKAMLNSVRKWPYRAAHCSLHVTALLSWLILDWSWFTWGRWWRQRWERHASTPWSGRFTGKTPEARLRQGLGYTKTPHRQPPAETPRPAGAGWRAGCRCAVPQPVPAAPRAGCEGDAAAPGPAWLGAAAASP